MDTKNVDNTNAQFDEARALVKKLFMKIARSVDPNYKEPEEE